MSIRLDKDASVEFVLFDAFANFLARIDKLDENEMVYEKILRAQDYPVTKRNIFFCYVGQTLLDNLSARSVANIYSGTPIDEDRFKFFCTKFENVYKELSPEKQNECRAIETAFVQWKSNLYKKYNLKDEVDSLYKEVITYDEKPVAKYTWEPIKENAIIEESDSEISGHYKVVYKINPDDRSFHLADKIQILTLNNGQIRVVYIKKENKGKFSTWIGEGQPNFDCLSLSILLKGPVNQSKQLDEPPYVKNDPIFLMISIPTKITEKIEVLCAIFAGSRGHDYGPVGRLILLVKESFMNGSKSHELDGIDLFFNRFKDRSWLRPPATDKIITLARHVKLVTEMFEKNL